MTRKNVVAILSVGFLLAMTSSVALAFVPDPIFWVDAADNPAHPDGWTNLGTAGGVIPALDPVPVLEPAAGPDGTPTYTASEAGQSFGADGGASLFFADWSLEIWMNRHDQAVGGGEHQFLGFIDVPWPFGQCIILRFDTGGDGPDTGRVRLMLVSTGAGGVDNGQHFFPEVDIGKDEWHHVAFTFDNSDGMLRSYLDGTLVGEDETIQDYGDDVEMKNNAIFRSDPGDNADRIFSGSISIIRLYDKVLTDEEILGNLNNPRTISVEPVDKLTETWGKVKTSL